MPLTVEAIYENGVLKPAEPLPLTEHEKVRLTVVRETSLESVPEVSPLPGSPGRGVGGEGLSGGKPSPPHPSPSPPSTGARGLWDSLLADQTYGIIGWKGDAATFDRLLAEAEEDEEFP
jgi:predicted DNA-binding antitoxin AbrB/MazE fold protein